jgi:hypothetical protein
VSVNPYDANRTRITVAQITDILLGSVKTDSEEE